MKQRYCTGSFVEKTDDSERNAFSGAKDLVSNRVRKD